MEGALAAAALLAGPPPARCVAADPAAAQIDAFDAALLETMKAGKALGPEGRYRKLEPAVRRAFDLGTMTRFTVGLSWAQIPPATQQALAAAFERLTVASYAHNFDGWSGETFVADPNVITRGPDKLVRTQIISPHDAPVAISYRLRQSGGAWKIIDVLYNGSISQLTTRRADFAATLAQEGPAGLAAHLNALADHELKGGD